jgi:spore coat protein U-like protein
MRKNAFHLASFLAVTALLGAALPAYAKNKNCSFQASGLSMSFGVLNPSSGVDAFAPVTGLMAAGDCAGGQTMTISGDNGLNYTGSRNLKNSAGDLISYDLVGLPNSQSAPGKGNYVAFDFHGTILWSAYANASAGLYSDTVIISVTP